ncbi:DUF262 domain-containing protein [Halomonas sp. SpR1]|uniref:DUF262 domain-containing protein n=1 Tax=Halomonas sp. SpR1 TaxID=3050462 RepID=UPI0027E5761F|nr:DUF262 domain-containing protein [Halomonas sp. SpR1]MDQ7732358.1 DUF262 domain-containing protein [Halomonas sp. SpR1]
MSIGSQINYKQLLDRHERIRIPMIQRDFAQGRPSEVEVRDTFLGTLKVALEKPADDPSLPLNLDFIYGSVEGDGQTRFQPLDGQQRLTTLYLLHWYLAWLDDAWADFEKVFLAEGRSRFAYTVRPSSNEFFDELVCYRPTTMPGEVPDVAGLIADQPWYFRSWRLDPTIQAVLHMLNAIHARFAASEDLFARLLDAGQPAITFQLLDLHNFGLSDDLYIKMNARGKPLTAFELFKARYEQELESQLEGEIFTLGGHSFDAAEYIARRMDTNWADLFWKHRSLGSNLYDDAFMNVFRAVALISRNPESSQYLGDVRKLRQGVNLPSYTDFHSHGWLDEAFTSTLICLLDSWCGKDGELCQLLPDARYFNEKAFFSKITSDGANLSYVEMIQFVAYSQFLMLHRTHGINAFAFQEWMRVIWNLAVNTSYNRADDFRRSVQGVLSLLEHTDGILTYVAQAEKAVTGFSELQLEEEKQKAQLIQAHNGWRPLIDKAESHGYFLGQIGFLLDFTEITTRCSDSIPESWDISEHVNFQSEFIRHLSLAEAMFSARGLSDPGEYRWQRALLSFGDYLLPSGRNRSFLVNATTEEASWKRLLSGAGRYAKSSRDLLKTLFSSLTTESDMAKQLDEIIEGVENIDSWREAVINCPSVLDYCQRRLLRVEYGHIYLLKRSQMNGAHAELFTYCLYKKLKSGQRKLSSLTADYESVTDTYSEPYIRLSCDRLGVALSVEIGNDGNEFVVNITAPEDTTVAELLARQGFEQAEEGYRRAVDRDSAEDFLRNLDEGVNAH